MTAQPTQRELPGVGSLKRRSSQAKASNDHTLVETAESDQEFFEANFSTDGTVVEGLSPITEATDDDKTHRVDSELISVVEASGFYQIRQSRRNITLWLGAWLVTVVLSVAMTATYYSGLDDDGAAGDATVVSEPVLVDGGPFLEGLDDEIRAFILLTCQKVADDPDECDESKLLAGEFPQKTMDLPAFLIDSTEVTVGAFDDCVDEGVCPEIDFKSCRVYTHQGLQVALRVPKLMLEPHMPVACVTRDEAVAYCSWKGGALPTNSQWEKAARGPTGRLFPWGNSWNGAAVNWGELDIIKSHVVGKIDGFEWTAPVGSLVDGSTETGIYDMAGNVAEWVAGKDALIGHVRGGSWTSNPFELRTTGRQEHRADVRRTDVGFRCIYSS